MKIALVHIRHAHSGGTERYLNHLASYLAEREHEVTIVCRRHVEAPHPRVRFQVLHGFALGAAWRMWSFAKEVEAHVQRSSYDLVFGLGKTWTHDVVRLGGGLHSTYLRLAHEETLSSFERLIGKGERKNKYALEIEKRALAPDAAKRFITNSRMVAKDLQRVHEVDSAAIEVIYNGVDLERFDREKHAQAAANLRSELSIEPEAPVLLFLGTGYGRKGLDLVLEAFKRIHSGNRDARLVVVGYDSAKSSYEARARELGIGDASRFLGGRRDVEVCYAAADLYCLPTRFDPFANSTLEALASGLPVITSTSNGGSELITDVCQGAVMAVEDGVDGLAAALQPWFDRDRIDICRPAVRRLAEQHSIESKLEQTERVLKELQPA